MTQSRKRTFLLLLSAILLSLILLSSSLSHLQLHGGVPFPAADTRYSDPKDVSVQAQTYSFTFLQGVLGLGLLLLMIYVPARLILFVKVRWLFRILQVLLVLLAAAALFSFIKFDTSCKGDGCSAASSIPPPEAPVLPAEGPLPEVINALVVGSVVAAGLLLLRIVIRRRRPPAAGEVVQHAESAVDAIRSGQDFRNVIIRCYSQMAAALQKEYGIERSANMTSREFEQMLTSMGFPPGPVHELTQLFERVRYGQEPLDRNDEAGALESLEKIIRFAKGSLHE